jgi:apolipoprotein N-acyltransferase
VALNSETWQLSEKKQLVVFPEYSGTFDTVITEREKNMLTIIENGQQSMFMDAETFYKDGKHYNRLALLQKDGTVIDGQYKSFLIPAGEYIPSYTSFMLMKFGGGTILNSFQDRVITKSREKIRPFDVYGTEVGALACSGAIAPELYRTLTKQGSELLINSASLGIFRNAPTYYRQNLQLARLEAVANARPFIQVARQGPSFVVDKDGIVIDHKEPRTSTQVTSYTLQKNTHHTPYTILGEWLIVAGFIYTAFMTCWKLQFNQRRIIARLRLLQQFFARHRHQNGS